MRWSGGLSDWTIDNTAYISVVFSWKLPDAYQRAVWYKSQGYHVRAGGPATAVNPKYLARVAEVGGSVDAITKHNPNATIASRGCPVGCYFCIVPRVEGKEFTLLWDFVPRPILMDNNLSALPVEFQEYIIKRYQEENVKLADAQSGFEPRSFDRETYLRWKKVISKCWRLAFDEMKEAEDVERMMGILANEPSYKKRVYVLIGNEPVDTCVERAMKVIEWGGEPYCQPFIAINSLKKKPLILYDWTEQKLADMSRWANKWIWRTVTLNEYTPRLGQANLFTKGERENGNKEVLFVQGNKGNL